MCVVAGGALRQEAHEGVTEGLLFDVPSGVASHVPLGTRIKSEKMPCGKCSFTSFCSLVCVAGFSCICFGRGRVTVRWL